MENEPVLCYIKNPWAFFTHIPMDQQWGDDHDDRPYEFNSGLPYDHPPKYKSLTVVAYAGDLVEPCDEYLYGDSSGSPYSVKDINDGVVPWLKSSEYHTGEFVSIWAGTPLSEFIELVHRAGGKVYTERQES